MSRRLRRLLAWGLPVLFALVLVGYGFIAYQIAAGLLDPAAVREMVAEQQGADPGDPREALGLAFEDVEVDTPLGPAPAWYVPADGAGTLGAIFVHGIGGRRADGYDYLGYLHGAGLPTLLVTYRNDAGAPASEDGRYGFGQTEWRDLEAAVAEMRRRGHTRLILVGESMGGAIVGEFLARSDGAASVAGLILDSPALSGRPVLSRVYASFGIPLPALGALMAVPPLRLFRDVDLGADLVPVVADFDGPVLLLHGGDDEAVPPAISERVAAARAGETLFLRTSAGHIGSTDAAPELAAAAVSGLIEAVRDQGQRQRSE